MKLSVCIITNNNHKVLDAIKSVYGFASEIILVNTVDEFTMDVSEFKDKLKLFPFKWCNDFSKARNYGIEKATGEHIMVLDSDEVCKTTIEFLDPAFDLFFVNIFNNEKKYESLRIFKNNIGIKFKNKVHESLEHCVKNNNTAKTEIRIEHSGYEVSEFELNEKRIRNYKLMLEDYDNPVRNFHLANYYFVNEMDFSKAREYYLKALQDEINEEHKAMCFNNIFACDELIGYPVEIKLASLMQSIEVFPYQLQARVNLIEVLLKMINKSNKKKYIPFVAKEINKVMQIQTDKLSMLHSDLNIDKNFINQKNKELQKWQ